MDDNEQHDQHVRDRGEELIRRFIEELARYAARYEFKQLTKPER